MGQHPEVHLRALPQRPLLDWARVIEEATDRQGYVTGRMGATHAQEEARDSCATRRQLPDSTALKSRGEESGQDGMPQEALSSSHVPVECFDAEWTSRCVAVTLAVQPALQRG